MRRGPWSRRPSPVRRCLVSRPREQVNGRQVERRLRAEHAPCPTKEDPSETLPRSKVVRSTGDGIEHCTAPAAEGSFHACPQAYRRNTRRTSCSPSTSASMSARVVCTANARARRGRHAEPAHQRLRAVVAGAHAHALRPRISPTSCGWAPSSANETSAPRSAGVRAVDRQPGHLGERVERVRGDRLLVGADRLDPERVEPVDGGAEPDRLGDLRGARLELPRQVRPTSTRSKSTVRDHVAAAR